MLRPSMYQIIGKHDSYYKFVVAVAQCAREIAQQNQSDAQMVEKPVKLAVEEFAQGKVKVNDYV